MAKGMRYLVIVPMFSYMCAIKEKKYIPEKGGDESQPPNKCSGGVFSLRFMLCVLHLRAVHHRDQLFAAGGVPISIDLLLAYPTMTRFPHCLEKNSDPKQLSHSTALFDYSATSLKPNASSISKFVWSPRWAYTIRR